MENVSYKYCQNNDRESCLGDSWVRKYDDGIGRFTCTDKLFEKYYEWSPFVYSANNPVGFKDDNGLFFKYSGTEQENNKYKEVILFMCNSKEGKEIVDYLANTNGTGLTENVELTFGKVEETGKAAYTNTIFETVNEQSPKGGIEKDIMPKSTKITIDLSKVTGKQDLANKIIHELIHAFRHYKDPNNQYNKMINKEELKKEEKDVQKSAKKIYKKAKELE
jgi:RHS repeat-associated protein